jgi:hypothetical protein
MNGAIFGKYNGASEPAPEDIVDRKRKGPMVYVAHEGKRYELYEGDTFMVTIHMSVDSPSSTSKIDMTGTVTSPVKIVGIYK